MEVAGFIIGLVPLGYKVYTELDDYIEAVHKADSETASFRAVLRQGKSLLQLFDIAVKHNEPIPDELRVLLAETCAYLRQELDSAAKIVAKLRGEKNVDATEKKKEKEKEGGGGLSQVSHSISKRRKYTYYFRRENLQKLEQHLGHANSHLSNVLQMYSLVASRVVHEKTFRKLEIIHTDVQSRSTVSVGTSKLLLDEAWNQEPTKSSVPSPAEETVVTDFCQCHSKSQVKRSLGGSRWFSLHSEQKTTIFHDPGCIYHCLEESRTEQSYTLTLNGRNVWSRLSTVIAVSVNIPSSRFSQWFISPQLRTFNVINLEESPAIRLFDFADELRDLVWDDPSMEKEARTYWHHQIIKVFQSGKASPFDVDWKTQRPMLHFVPFASRKGTSIYERIIWNTLQQLNFPDHMRLCNGLEPWAYSFSKSLPLYGGRLDSQLLPWQVERWLEPKEVPDALLEGTAPASGKLGRAFVLALIMSDRRSLFESSNIGCLCQAIIMRRSNKVLDILDDNISTWEEPFLSPQSGIRAIDLAIMWFPELVNALLEENRSGDPRLSRLRLPRPHPSKHSFLDVAINFGLRFGEKFGKASTQDYLAMISLALERDHPIYFHRVSLNLGPVMEEVTLHLADRRRRLLALAQRQISKAKLGGKNIWEPRLVDAKVEEVIQAFMDQGVSIPEALQPRDLHGPEDDRLADSIFEYAWESEDLCKRLEEVGFDPEDFIRRSCRRAKFVMAPLMAPRCWDSWRFLWLEAIVSTSKTEVGNILISAVSRLPKSAKLLGAVIQQDNSGPPTFLHALMAYLGHCMPGKRNDGFMLPDPDISPFIKPRILDKVCDSCVCGCSDSGCSYLATFIRPILFPFDSSKLWLYLERVRYTFQILQLVFDGEAIPTSTVLEVLRICTFECMGGRHTCCENCMKEWILRPIVWENMDAEDCLEIREEDSEKLDAVEEIMQKLTSALMAKVWKTVDFVETCWVPLIKKEVWRQEELQLSATEVGLIKDIGVNWNTNTYDNRNGHDEDECPSTVALRMIDEAFTDRERLKAVKLAIDLISD